MNEIVRQPNNHIKGDNYYRQFRDDMQKALGSKLRENEITYVCNKISNDFKKLTREETIQQYHVGFSPVKWPDHDWAVHRGTVEVKRQWTTIVVHYSAIYE